jgi:hypothetical protein
LKAGPKVCGKFQTASQNKRKANTEPTKARLQPVAKRRPTSGREQSEKQISPDMLRSLAEEHWDDVYSELTHGWTDDGGNEPPTDHTKDHPAPIKRERGTKHRAGRKIQFSRFMRLLGDIQSQEV